MPKRHTQPVFPSKSDVAQNAPDPAVRQMLDHAAMEGLETCFDRFDAQKPHCRFGLAGSCCRNCAMGPCRITEKSPRGVCGANADVVVARNLLRSLAAAVSSHGARSREVMLALKAAAAGQYPWPQHSEDKLRNTARALGIDGDQWPVARLAQEVAGVLLEDLSRTEPATHRTIQALAPAERLETWRRLGILPISAYHEVFEALHRTTTGTDGDWENLMRQFLRCGLAFAWSSVMGGALAMDCLYGLPQRSTITANLGTLEDGYVNIAIHGHSPVMASCVVAAGHAETFLAQARNQGAKGIRFYGICCSGLSSLYRYGDVHPLANAMGAELALATGALDLWVADFQDIFPSIMDVANCRKTLVVTTSDSCHLPGAHHHGFDHEHLSLDQAERMAGEIVQAGIERFAIRRHVKRFIPNVSVEAEIGFSVENVLEAFGGAEALARHLREGTIAGLVNLVGCSNPKVLYEGTVLAVTDILLAHDVLVLTNGCASFPLLKLGYCHGAARGKTGQGLQRLLTDLDLPPVLHMGECLDNARASGLFKAVSQATGLALSRLPFAFASPEWSNEKGLGAALSFRLMGIDSYHCVEAAVGGSENVRRFLEEETRQTLGSVMVTIPQPEELARRIVRDLHGKRRTLGWKHSTQEAV
mgnify:CR=1 FL=1